MTQNSDHDLLVELNTKVDIIMKSLDNHLAHHSKWQIAMLSITFTSIVTALIAILGMLRFIGK